MSATIIQFPDRMAVVSAAARSNVEARRRQDAVTAGLAADWHPSGTTERDWVGRAHHVLDHIEDLLGDGDADEVVELCQRAMRCLLDAAPDIGDTGGLVELVARLREVHVRACRAAQTDPVELADFVYGLARSDELGVLHGVIDPYVPLLGATGMAAVRRHLAEDQRRQRSMTGLTRKLAEHRLRPILTSLARAQHPSVG